MAGAVAADSRFMLRNMNTGFEITTTANIRMLFLSMPLAQRGINGVVPPSVMPIEASDYRGY